MSNIKPRALGRGLSELLSSSAQMSASFSSTQTDPSMPASKPHFLPVDLLQRGKYQPRKEFPPKALSELADSIAAQGVLQPILVREISPSCYEIIAGERRWRAAQMVGLQELPVFIRDISDEAAMAMSLIENIQREDLNVIEQAIALKRLGDECGMTHEDMATAVGKSRATITNVLRLLQLAPPVIKSLEKNELEMGHARALLSLSETDQIKIAQVVILKQLSVRETEALVRNFAIKKTETETETVTPLRRVDPDIARLQTTLSDRLGASVFIKQTSPEKGKLVIHYHSLEELEGVLEKIK